MQRTLLLTLLFLAAIMQATAQQRGMLGVGFYDVDKLYDTLPSRFYNDSDYTPEGRLKWTTNDTAARLRKPPK